MRTADADHRVCWALYPPRHRLRTAVALGFEQWRSFWRHRGGVNACCLQPALLCDDRSGGLAGAGGTDA
jgi:hypothetical protein